MTHLQRLCSNITNTIRLRIKSIDQEKAEIINYGLYLWVTDVIKLAITLSLAYILGVLGFTLITLISFGVLRTFSGGAHAKTFLGCLSTNSIITFSIVYSSLLLSYLDPMIPGSILLPVCFLIIYLYAPADHENKPVVSKKQRQRFRILAYIILLLEYIIALAFTHQPISNILIIAPFAASLLMLPAAYKLTGSRHSDSFKRT
ncbi:MAG: accessory gene regulator ArgB-like protein [Bacillota bacterium]